MASIDELWLVDFGEPHPAEPSKHRPGLVLGPPSSFGNSFPFVFVAPATTTHHGLSLHVEVEASPETGLDEVSYIQCEMLRSVNGHQLVHRLGAVNPEVHDRVSAVVRTLLDL